MKEIDTTLLHANDLTLSEWSHIYTLQQAALRDAMPDRTEEQITAMLGNGTFARYVESRIDPNSEVGKTFNDDQSYWAPRVAIAFRRDDPNQKPIGYAYAAGNVSGSRKIVRAAKHIMPSKNYLWMREIAVDPDHQRRGIAKELGRTLLRDAMPFRAVSTYIWPGETPGLQHALETLRFVPQDEQYVEVFGEGSYRIRQVRMVAPRVGRVLGALKDS